MKHTVYSNNMNKLGQYERITDTHLFFVRGPFSQWYPSEFRANHFLCEMMGYAGKVYNYTSCEQYMMHNKAILFQDIEVANLIMETNNVKKIKEYGRQVKNYDQVLWDLLKFEIVVSGNMHKFSNPILTSYICKTNDLVLVEAAWYDKIWGIGLRQDDDRVLLESKWEGQNLLGKALMVVRSYLSSGSALLYDEYRKDLLDKIDNVISPLVEKLRNSK